MQTPSSNENTGSRWQGNPCVDCPWLQHRGDGQTMLPSFEDIPDGSLPREPRQPRRRRPPAPAPNMEPLFEIEEPNSGEAPVLTVQIRELNSPDPRTVIVTVPDPDQMCGNMWERHLRTVVLPEHFARPFTVEVAVVEARNLLWLGRTVRIACEATSLD